MIKRAVHGGAGNTLLTKQREGSWIAAQACTSAVGWRGKACRALGALRACQVERLIGAVAKHARGRTGSAKVAHLAERAVGGVTSAIFTDGALTASGVGQAAIGKGEIAAGRTTNASGG